MNEQCPWAHVQKAALCLLAGLHSGNDELGLFVDRLYLVQPHNDLKLAIKAWSFWEKFSQNGMEFLVIVLM